MLAACGSAPPESVVDVAYATRARWEALGPTSESTLARDSTVWVVTVHADMRTDGTLVAAPRVEHAYTVVIGASSPKYIDFCIGCMTSG